MKRTFIKSLMLVLLALGGITTASADYKSAGDYNGVFQFTSTELSLDEPWIGWRFPSYDNDGNDDALRYSRWYVGGNKAGYETYRTNPSEFFYTPFWQGSEILYMEYTHGITERKNAHYGVGDVCNEQTKDELRSHEIIFYPGEETGPEELNYFFVRWTGFWDIDDNEGSGYWIGQGSSSLGNAADGSVWQGPGVRHRGNGVARYAQVTFNIPETKTASFVRKPGKKIEVSITGTDHADWTEYYGFGDGTAVDEHGYYINSYGMSDDLLGGKATYVLDGTFDETETYTIYYHQLYKRSQTISGQQAPHNKANDATKIVNQHFQASRISTVVPGYMYPSDLQVTQDKWNKEIKLTWTINQKDADHNTEGGWLVFRQKVGDNNIEQLTSDRFSNSNTSYTDKTVETGAEYTYWVTFAPKVYGDVTEPIASKLTCSTVAKHDNTFAFTNVNAELNDGTKGGILLTWSPEREGNDVTFIVQRWNEEYKRWDTMNGSGQTTTSYIDTDVESWKEYKYRIKTTYWGLDMYSEEKTICYAVMTAIKGLTASQGTYSNMVKLNWDATVLSQGDTRYVVSRKLLGDQQAVFIKIYEVVGSGSTFYYEDLSALPGQYYEYKVTVFAHVEASGTEEAKWVEGNSKETDGFVQARGLVTGRVKYGTGTAVQGAKVILSKNDNDNTKEKQFYSLYLNGGGDAGLEWKLSADVVNSYFAGSRPWSVQFYVRPETGATGTQSVLDVNGYAGVSMAPTTGGYLLYVKSSAADGPATSTSTGIVIPADVYTHIVLSYDGNSTYTLRTIVPKGVEDVEFVEGKQMKTFTGKANVKFDDETRSRTIKFGASGFKGYIDEVRVWGKVLTDQEIVDTYDRTLTCTEASLLCYWPMDEGISGLNHAYDYSKTNGIANGNHAAIKGSAAISEVVPPVEQLSLYGLTDVNGNYIIRGVPFSGDGTTYLVRPVMGIHEFSPNYHTRYVSSSSLTHDDVSFEDISSFPVSGVVYYENTTYPVQGCYLYVDGNVCAKEGKVVETDEYGRFEISVPIGEHYISVTKNGHTFVNEGRYPAGVGVKYTFEAPVSNLTFYDNTLVHVAGRVVGGDIEGSHNVGFGLSKNNIGVAQLVLTPTNDIYSLNVVKKVDGSVISYENNSQVLACASSSSLVNSNSWRGSGDNAGRIYINTDAASGEFSAMVPPLVYNVSAPVIQSKGQTICDPVLIDVSNPLSTASDTLVDESGNEHLFKYNVKYNCVYHSEPSFTVLQADREDDMYGIGSYATVDASGDFTVDIINSTRKSYNYGMPFFIQGDPYTFKLKGFEQYTNYDSGKAVTTTVPLKNCVVTISNALSEDQAVLAEKDARLTDEDIQVGDVVNLEPNQLKLDENGEATYKWKAGFANITAPYSRTLSITYEVGGQVNAWKCNGKEYMEAVILGDMPTGSNFVTMGPDRLVMVLRDPPGSGSSAEWSKGTVVASEEVAGLQWSTENVFKDKEKMNVDVTTLTGVGTMLKNSSKAEDEFTAGMKIVSDGEYSEAVTYSISTSEAIATSSDPNFVGTMGDLYIGFSTNQLFGKAREVGFTRDAQGRITLGVEDVISVGSTFETYFAYSYYYIKTYLLPNFEALRNRLLIPVSEAEYNNFVNDTDGLKFITKLSPDDPKFGSDNNDKEVWGDKAVGNSALEGPSYKVVLPQRLLTTEPVERLQNWIDEEVDQDSVRMYNTQIANWKRHLAQNEEAKVKAWENRAENLVKNYSFSTGSSVSFSYGTEESYTSTIEHSTGRLIILGNVFGFEVNAVGYQSEKETTTGTKLHNVDSDTETESASFSFNLVEDGDDALSVDVYKGGPYGYIFRTRGGQTSAPYEAEEYTQYYQPGKHKLHEATMQIEVPEIAVEQAVVTNQPSGTAATYTLLLSNNSEIDFNLVYDLKQLDETNPNGAQLLVDGLPLADGRAIKVNAGELVKKTLLLSQSNPSILDYENIGIMLISRSQGDPTGVYPVISDTVYVSAHFVPSSSPVKMELGSTLLNSTSGANLDITFNDFDRNYHNLKAFRIQYMKQGDTDWTLLREYLVNVKSGQQLSSTQEKLPETANVTYSLDMSSFADGKYTFRVLSASTYGTGESTWATEAVEVLKDMARPMVFGTPKPATGFLGVGDDIALTFNEDINTGRLTSTGNFLVTAALNGAVVAHDIAMNASGAEEPVAKTEADINLIGKSFAVDMWVRISGEGTIFSHGNGSNKMQLGAKKVDGKYYLTVNGEMCAYPDKALPADKWFYLAFSMNQEDADGAYFSALYADDAASGYLAYEQPADRYEGNGVVALGEGFTGAVHEVALWDAAIEVENLQAQMHDTKLPTTEHLIGYWKLNEGAGTQAKDLARNRHMSVSGTGWYLNNKNKALNLVDGTYGKNDALAVNLSECAVLTGDDYMIELWFRAETKQDNEVAYILDNDAFGVALESGKMKLYAGGKAIMSMGTKNYNDGMWHHLAINVLRNGNTVAYVDGEAVGQMASANVPALQTNYLYLGAHVVSTAAQDAMQNKLRGAVDELRVWNATVNASVIRNRMGQRLQGDEPGLVAYYPFEVVTLDANSQVVTEASALDMVTKRHRVAARKTTGSALAYVDEAPALKPASNATNLNYSFVASDRGIVIELNEDADRLEGVTVNITVKDVLDMNGNKSLPVTWTALVKRNQLIWFDDNVEVVGRMGEEQTFTAIVSNQSAQPEHWVMGDLPSWLSANFTSGSLPALGSQEITFTVDASAPTGKSEFTIYMSGNNAILVPLTVNMNLKADAPDWSVDPSEFEGSATLFAAVKIKVDGKVVYSEDEDDLVAAFVDGRCVGVTNVKYESFSDSYRAYLNIHGHTEDAGKNIELNVWDASTGLVHPMVKVFDNTLADVEAEEAHVLTYEENMTWGDYDEAYTVYATNYIQQSTALTKNWNWISVYVDNKESDNDINYVLQSINPNGTIIKNASSHSEYLTIMGKWHSEENVAGNVSKVSSRSMYKLHMNAPDTLAINGEPADGKDIEIKKGWNWIPYSRNFSMSVDDALASAVPARNDQIKGQEGYAMYNGTSWNGTLTSLTPGKGYLYKRSADEATSISYPTLRNVTVASAPVRRTMVENMFAPVDPTLYESNMTVLAVVKKDDEIMGNVQEIGVFDGTVCLASATVADDGYFYLTIPGDRTQNNRLSIIAVADGNIIETSTSLYFGEDATLGNFDNPFVVVAGEAAAIDQLLAEGNCDRVRVVDLGGRVFYAGSVAAFRMDDLKDGQYIFEFSTKDGQVVCYKQLIRRFAE